MESSNYMGLMAVMAASGSVVLVALQAHRRLVSDFRRKFEIELNGGVRGKERKKKVRFAADVVEPSSNNKEYRRRHSMAIASRIRAMERISMRS
ncbi:hypothetical protein ZOSMA_116G00390 [Zostera marina]|uniref:Uncharacterized protein n=1 Tax=Zostera marina TaxID=29655 RepID=A0A0K9Q201_ZOSMR|nr:hypothetical protein ZOSMA_116G00390 [Zostera marina]